jgi:RNA polymerase sigma-70 factor (ECF subfamily)
MSETEFMAVYDALADPIFRHCYYRVYDRERAKDLTQETFTRFWKYANGGKEVRSAKALLYQIATNLVIDEARKRKRGGTISLDVLYEEYQYEPGEDDRDRLHDVVDGRVLLTLLEEVDEQYREVLKLRYVEDMHPKEIAEVLKTNRNTVSLRINRGLKQLRQKLEAKEHAQEA